MGADIHIFAETGSGSRFDAISDGAFDLPRDYKLFAALAGVRAAEGFEPHFPPRGIPANVSQEVSERYFVPVLSDDTAARWQIGEHFTKENARQMVSDGISTWLPEGTTAPLTPATDGYISNPDWHSASWLDVPEVVAALEHANYPQSQSPIIFRLLLQYLRGFTCETGLHSRVVFWFDN